MNQTRTDTAQKAAMDESVLDIAEQARIASEEGYPFLFSVVIALYNAEADLAESIESVIGQTVGMEHIQLVLVDDGSTDGSAEICQSYADRYPDNIVLIRKENGGVSSARNAGIGAARGKYINFLDSDDKWTLDSFEATLAFFCAHPGVRLAAARYVYFGAREGDHRLNYKFEQDAVIDLKQTYDYPQLSSSTCFFHASALEGRRFSEALSVSEDVLIVNQILLDTMEYGVMAKPTYLYRQHAEKESAIDTMKDNVSWYLDTPDLCYRHLFDLSQEKNGSILPFIQFTVMYDLQWRIRSRVSEQLSEQQVARYRELLTGLLRDIDDYIISEQRTISIDQVAYAFALKHGTTMDDILDHLSIKDGWLAAHITDRNGAAQTIRLRPIDALSDRLTIEHLAYDGNAVSIKGYVTSFRFRPRDLKLSLLANNKPMMVELSITDEHKPKTPFGEDIVGKTGFACAVDLPASQQTRIKAVLTLLDTAERPLRFAFGDTAGLPKAYEEGDCALIGGALFQIGAPDALTVRALGQSDDCAAILQTAETCKSAANAAPGTRYRAAAWRIIAR